VLDGELTFQLGDDVFTRGAGGRAFAPRGAHHAFANHSGEPARALLVCTPAGFERYFEGLEPWPEVVKVGPRIAATDDIHLRVQS
jgi:quercetin dioxygenase-like cupin family protein